ncbi:MAG TPA: DNA-binding transcriptional regulator [Verrucomicrobiae bacterium]|nr:DNA-binding transcriptional regulator [Verrucomicrobiae bacterium]
MAANNRNRAPKSLKVALLIESSRIYGRGILRGIAKYAHLHGQWSCFTEERELHSGIPAWLGKWKGHGIISRIEDPKMAAALRRTGLPVVDVLGNARFPGISAFGTDARAVAKLAADFFLKAGFQHFAFCGYPRILFSERRRAEYCAYLAEKKKKVLVFAPPLPKGAHSHIQAIERHGLSMEKSIAAWLANQPRPLALFACNDVFAQQVLNACRERGIKVPEEVAVMGVDNDDVLCNLCQPPLTSIEPNAEELGFQAAALLDHAMRGKPLPEKLRLIPPIRIVERASTDIVAIEDAVTVQAVRYIRDHVGNGIAVKDVLAHVNRSRTDVEQRFRRWLGCSIHSEMLRLRLERVQGLLRLTDLNLNQVAHRAGFATAAHVCRLFQRYFRQTPMEYRKGNQVE